MRRARRPFTVVPAVFALALATGACEEPTVRVSFDPAVGDTYDVRSDVAAEVARTVEGRVERERTMSHLDATERVVAVDDETVGVEVTVTRDEGRPLTYQARLDPTGRLSSIDLVEGVPIETLGLDLATALPADISNPPSGPLEPGATWTIDRRVDGPMPFTVRGTGRVESLGVEHGEDVAVVVVELAVPLRSVAVTDDGEVALRGAQTVVSRTTYSLTDGAARTERTRIEGRASVTVAPPTGVVAPPVEGSIRYAVRTETHRAPAS